VILFMTEIVVSDFSAAVRWYRDVLGWSPQLLDEPRGFALFHRPGPADGGRLGLKAGTPVPGGVRLNFEVSDLAAGLARLAALGVSPVGPVKVSDEGYRSAAFRDPDGYAVVLFEWVKSPT
jgi:catechol 2,3-dioxygenase-like lactoylglutathione lyase family enzyme